MLIIFGIIALLLLFYWAREYEEWRVYNDIITENRWSPQDKTDWSYVQIPKIKFSSFKKEYITSPENWGLDLYRVINIENRKNVIDIRKYSSLEFCPSFIFSYRDWNKYRRFVKELYKK